MNAFVVDEWSTNFQYDIPSYLDIVFILWIRVSWLIFWYLSRELGEHLFEMCGRILYYNDVMIYYIILCYIVYYTVYKNYECSGFTVFTRITVYNLLHSISSSPAGQSTFRSHLFTRSMQLLLHMYSFGRQPEKKIGKFYSKTRIWRQ